MYNIKQYSYDQANKLNVEIFPSVNPRKKIDVFKNGLFLFSIGDIRYGDFPTFLEIDYDTAVNRRRLYKLRHAKDLKKIETKAYYSNLILW